MCRVLPCLTLITGTGVSFVAVDPSSHQLQEPQYWPTFCRNMFHVVLGCSGPRLYHHTGNWRRYSPSHIPLYIDDEWRHCRASAMVLELWQIQEERLDRNMGWIPRMVVAIFFFLLVLVVSWERFLHISEIYVSMFSWFICIRSACVWPVLNYLILYSFISSVNCEPLREDSWFKHWLIPWVYQK